MVRLPPVVSLSAPVPPNDRTFCATFVPMETSSFPAPPSTRITLLRIELSIYTSYTPVSCTRVKRAGLHQVDFVLKRVDLFLLVIDAFGCIDDLRSRTDTAEGAASRINVKIL